MMTRRTLLKSMGLVVLAIPLLQGCGGGAATGPATTAAAQAAKIQAVVTAQVNTASTPVATDVATTAAIAAQPTAPAGKVTLTVAVRTEANNQWIKHAVQEWAGQHTDVAVQIAEIPYGDMAKKQLTELATGTMQDVVYSGIKWFNYSALKGAFRPIDNYTRSHDPGMSDFFPAAIAGCTLDGKLYALPSELNTGNRDIIIYNKDQLEKKGLQPPTDDWTVNQFVELATKATDRDAKVFGTDFYPGSYYDYDALLRTWGGELFSDDGKKLNFGTDQKSLDAAHWAVDLRSKYHAAPTRAEEQGTAFPAGQIVFTGTGVYNVLALGKTVGDRFKWDAVLFPKGPSGLRGYEAFIVMWSVSSQSKQPEKAFEVVAAVTSKATGVWAVTNNLYEPNSRRSVWEDPQVQALHPIFKRVLNWFLDGKNQGPFPMPYNARFSELEDKYENISPPLWYGETPFDEGMKKVQQELQSIMDLPRP